MNVYYLPLRNVETETAAIPLASRWSVLRARTARLVWRLRLTGLEVWSVLRNGRRNPLEDHVWFADEPPVGPRRRAAGPARILDLEAGRRRRVIAVARAAVSAAVNA